MDAYGLARRLLFTVEPERAHNIGLRLVRFASRVDVQPTPVTTAFGELANPLGLAAGYDKTGRYLRSLARLGFGYIVAGTFTATPWPGNPKPRVARNKEERTLVNALGFPNPGVNEFVRFLESHRAPGTPVLGSISGRTVDDVLSAYKKVQPRVAGVELNLSSPNTPNLTDLRRPPAFAGLAEQVRDAKLKPSYLKIPPYLGEEEFKETLLLVRKWEDLGFEGVTAANSMLVADRRMAIGTGGYSGPPLFQRTKAAIETIRRSVGAAFEINAVGGVSSPGDAAALLGLGATTVQIFTALVYQGPALVKSMITDPEVRRVLEGRRASRLLGPRREPAKTDRA